MTTIRGRNLHTGTEHNSSPWWQLAGPTFPGAPCAETDPEVFFPNQGESPDAAKQVCAGCEHRIPCLEWALTHHEPGVWGGTTAKDRTKLRRQRRAA